MERKCGERGTESKKRKDEKCAFWEVYSVLRKKRKKKKKKK